MFKNSKVSHVFGVLDRILPQNRFISQDLSPQTHNKKIHITPPTWHHPLCQPLFYSELKAISWGPGLEMVLQHSAWVHGYVGWQTWCVRSPCRISWILSFRGFINPNKKSQVSRIWSSTCNCIIDSPTKELWDSFHIDAQKLPLVPIELVHWLPFVNFWNIRKFLKMGWIPRGFQGFMSTTIFPTDSHRVSYLGTVGISHLTWKFRRSGLFFFRWDAIRDGNL